MQSKKQRILNLIKDFGEFKFCGPSDDPDQQSGVCLGYYHLVTQLKIMATPFIPKNIAEPLSKVEVELDNLYSVYEASAVISALLPDIEEIVQGLDESVFDPAKVKKVAEKKTDVKIAEPKTMYYDINFFRTIKFEIRTYTEKYRKAGQWLDEYCSVESFWKVREEYLDNVKKYGPTYPDSYYNEEEVIDNFVREEEYKQANLIHEKEIEYLELMLKLKKGYYRIEWLMNNYSVHPEIFTTEWLEKELNRMGKVPGKSRLDIAYDFFTGDDSRRLFMGLEEARRIILITWLLYDRDSENSGLNLTGFESWPWSDRLPSTQKFLACYKKENWHSAPEDNRWMVRVRIAWDEIQAEKGSTQQDSTETGDSKQDFKADLAGKQEETEPDDIITLLVAVEKYEVSRATLKRAIESGNIKSYRKPNAAKNSPHRISRKNIEEYYNKR